jgi:RNA polymerase sigma factor (TIGR02999 family)
VPPRGNDELFDTLYNELHRLARLELGRRAPDAGLGVTTLLHEAYVNMAGRDPRLFPDRARFLGYAARVMRGLIVDYARSRHAQKRGGRFELTSVATSVAENIPIVCELAEIDEALSELATTEPELAQIVELKFFCGFSFAEIAAMHRVSERTIQRKWEKARLCLHHALHA